MFTWRYLNEAGDERGRSEPFPDREAAEAWMGEAWEDLLEAGHAEVALHDDDRDTRIYRMGLSEA